MPQKIDPFIPISKHSKLPAHSSFTHCPPKTDSTNDGRVKSKPPKQFIPKIRIRNRKQVMDIFPKTLQKDKKIQRVVVALSIAKALAKHRVIPTQTAETSQAHHRIKLAVKFRRLPQLTQLALLIIGATCVGLLIQSLAFGEIAIASYALYVIIKKVPSRNTFMLVLIALVGIVILQIIQGGESTTADNFAIYAYLLLVLGVVSLGFEVRRKAL